MDSAFISLALLSQLKFFGSSLFGSAYCFSAIGTFFKSGLVYALRIVVVVYSQNFLVVEIYFFWKP